jgi:protein TonB
MSALQELEPQVQERRETAPAPEPIRAVLPWQRPLFADSLLDVPEGQRRRRSTAAAISFAVQCVLIALLVIVPLMYTDTLPTPQLLTFLVAPAPPPPPPPPPAAAPAVKIVRQSEISSSGQLRTPTRIPQSVEMIKEEAAPPSVAGGVVGGVPGGIPGGQVGGVIGGIINATSGLSAIKLPAPPPPKRVRISQGVTAGLLLRKVEPKYPIIARQARIQGQVVLAAIIDRQGAITNLQVVSGHPMLIGAAIEAVKEWRYRPYLLNGEPVEVETLVIVTFQFAQ